MLGLMCCVPVTMAAQCATASSLFNTGCTHTHTQIRGVSHLELPMGHQGISILDTGITEQQQH